MLKIDLKGVDDLNKFLNEELAHDKKQLARSLVDASTNTHTNAVSLINLGGRSGKVYKRRTISHQASSSDEPPKTDTGTLVRNITIEPVGEGYTVGSRKGAPHGFWLEFGTSKMSPRPWLQPSFDKTVAWITRRIKEGRYN